MNEFWEPVPDFPKYEVSDLGRIVNRKSGRYLKPCDNGSGSYIVNLQNHRTPIIKQVRWIVAETFLEPPLLLDSVPQHIDRDPANCRADNLEWMTRSDIHWRVYEERQGRSPMDRVIQILETGEEFKNVFECAKHILGYAKEIDKTTRNSAFEYKGLQFRYLED